MFFLEFLFYLFFFIIKLYSLLDKKYILSGFGTKLEKYMKKQNLKNIDGNFVNTEEKESFFFKFLSNFKSPEISRRYFLSFAISITLAIFRISADFSKLNSNIYIISVFSKNIDLFKILDSKFYILISFFYFLNFSFMTYVINNFFVIKSKFFGSKKVDIQNDTPLLEKHIFLGKNSVTFDNVIIPEEGMYQNVLITGSIGSGKTSSVVSNILKNMLIYDIPGIVIDVKGNYISTVLSVAKSLGKEDRIHFVTLKKDLVYNPLKRKNMDAVSLAHDIRKVIENVSENNMSDSFWLDKAEDYIKCFLIILGFLKKDITFLSIHTLAINKEELRTCTQNIKRMVKSDIKEYSKFSQNEKSIFEVMQAINTIENEYMKLDERTISIIKAEITRITSPFVTDYELEEKFKNSEAFDFSSSNIYVFSINIFENRKQAKILATFFKLDFQKHVMTSKKKQDTFCMIDEYQEVANKDDAYFVSLSREFKCINIFSMQSYSSLFLALNNENASKVIIQNLVNKVWLRNDDVYTVSEVIKQIGSRDIKRVTLNISESGQDSKYSMIKNKMTNYKSGLSQAVAYASKKERTFTEEYFTQELKNFEAVILVSDGSNMKLYEKVNLKRWDD